MGEAAQQLASNYPLSRALMQTLQVYEAAANQSLDAGYANTPAPERSSEC